MRGRLGGWHRLFLVVACVHFGLVTLYVLYPVWSKNSNAPFSQSLRSNLHLQGHLVFGDGVAQQVQNKLKGFVPHGALLAWRAPHAPKPCLKVDLYDSTAAAPHRGLRRDSRLSPLSGQTPSLACRALAGLLCDVVWLPQL